MLFPFKIYVSMYMCTPCIVYTMYTYGASGGQKRALDPGTGVTYYNVGAGNQPWVLLTAERLSSPQTFSYLYI